MICGSGMLAAAFRDLAARTDVFIHAAGVSNSQCVDEREFAREREALERSLEAGGAARTFVYFSTCSLQDPSAATTAYCRHKEAMELVVRRHPGHLVLRLPHVAGRTPNPHTLLNYLHGRIARGERFALWSNARRNVIDCDDVRALGLAAIESGWRATTLNVANTNDHAVLDIVHAMERVVDGHAVFDRVERGAAYPIDVAATRLLMEAAGVSFGPDYLERVLRKYYGRR